MMLTLFARLYYVQLLDPNKPTQTAHAAARRQRSWCPRRAG